jgi:hypothetical protein
MDEYKVRKADSNESRHSVAIALVALRSSEAFEGGAQILDHTGIVRLVYQMPKRAALLAWKNRERRFLPARYIA